MDSTAQSANAPTVGRAAKLGAAAELGGAAKSCSYAGRMHLGLISLVVSEYGRVAVFRDIAGNKWDLIGPAS